ncbi:dihydrofolate reductase [Methylococcus sp. EFPC2]|uniref:dihydrofolate reductase n=1 Tax=Methylococcus sp. EFPC2 TaxID=2812648 RepID=UPI001967A0A9|nr:dihydrofolate reductase [Methylococcus sp. EFPC2]QSA96966.1 dihydrofolate reductase [Methylococcus sp. EFPC2]
MTRISLVVAMAANRVIGKDGRMPWHLSADLKYFKEVTWGKPILMGRVTHEAIGRPLPGRQNLVLTHDTGYEAPGCTVVHSLDEARAALPVDCAELMVIGGASLYQAFLPQADRLYLTLIHREFDGDTYFPDYDAGSWRELSRREISDDAAVDYRYEFLVLEKIHRSGMASILAPT